ncbi:MAG TPA: serine hydrolase [Gemmataceae bacterium]|nr:serine hydrolase [Gemmataceae bacterium]
MKSCAGGVRPALALFALVLAGVVATAKPPDPAVVDEILKETLKTWKAPGIAVAIVKDDKVVYLKGVGLRERGGSDAVTADTLFAIGSCTKAFTATALAILVDEGKADWDDLVRKHLPSFRLADPLADHDVRLRDLLCHRIGLARHDLLWYRAPWSVEESVRRMAFLERSSSFRSKYEYNNLAYLAAGLAISSAAKKPWDEFVRERLLIPLKMNNVVFTSAAARKACDHASPHGHAANGNVVVLPWDGDDTQIRASGSMKASARDMSQWLRFQLARDKFRGKDGKPLVSADALEETRTPHTVVPLTAADRAAGTRLSSYGLGWHITDYRGHALHEHGGAVDGFRARIILVPKQKLGLVLLTNLEDREIVNAAGNNLLDRLLGLEKKDWDTFFTKERQKAQAARQERLRKRPMPVRGTKPSRELEAYVGTYTEPAYGTVKISRQDENLVLKWSSFQFPLKHFHYDTFVMPPKNLRLPASLAEEFAVFELNEDAEISIVRFLGRKFTRDQPRKNDP